MASDVRKILDDIVRLVQSDRLADALARCDDALGHAPDDVNLVAMKGAVLFRQGDLDAGQTSLEQAIEMEPAFLKPREDLGALYLAKGEIDKAIAQLRKAVAIDPDNAAVVGRLTAALEQSGRDEEAESVRNAFTDRMPVDALLTEAERLFSAGSIGETEKFCDAVLQREPQNSRALKLLAMAANEDERFVIAEAFLTRIVRLAPDDPGALIDLAAFLNGRSRYPEAIEYARRAAALDPSSADIQLMLGNLYSIIGKSDDAVAAYQQCLEKEPDNASALVGRGHLLRIDGKQDEAMADYRRSLEIRPDFGAAWWYLSSLHRFSASDEEVRTMQEQLERGELTPDAQVGLHFALARAFEKRDDYEAAWQHYSAGNAGKRALVRYDPVMAEVEHQNIRRTYTAELLSRVAGLRSDVTPIFIVGMPRSGSTLIEQILASHSRVEGTGELPYIVMMTTGMTPNVPGALHYTELVGDMSGEEMVRLGRNYLANASTYRVEGTPFFTDKMPANYPHVGFIRQILPDAKIIDARRDPMATCVANYRQLFAQGKNQSYDLEELGDYYVEYVKMMAHWDEVMPGVVLRVQYENVVDDLESEVRRILDHCGLPFEEGCLEYHKSARPVNTASAEQVREPIYRSALEFWRNYEPYLDELKAALAPVM
jgi:tetratricopeptide (TPR) repeat protein